VDGLLIYDGDCQFCQLSLDFGIRHLPIFPQYVAFQRINPADFKLSSEDVASQIWLVNPAEPEANKLGGHLAAAQILAHQRQGYWRALGFFMKTPPTSHLAKWVYRLVAKNRHRLPGGTRACKLEDNYQPPKAG
jgi:predicted DCC family thiol-disulfide oxidoreductase YuxK